MGFISELVKGNGGTVRQAVERGSAQWRQTFGVIKERDEPKPNVYPGGSFGRSVSTTDASLRRLWQAMRSRAPGNWSDNRVEQTNHQVGIQQVCIHRIGEQIAQSEFTVFHRDDEHPDGRRVVTKDDPPEGNRMVRPYDLVKLLENPNPDDSWGDLAYRWNQQLSLTGTALTWMVENKLGAPFELYSVPTMVAIPQPAINPDYPDGYYRIQPVYPYGPFSSYPTPASAVGAAVDARWMLRFQYPHPLLRYDGYSPLTALRFHIDELEMMDKSRHYSMRKSEEEIDRIRAEYENSWQGPENAGSLYVATPGGRLEPWGTNPKEMDYPNSWDQLTSFIMAGFGITKPAAGMVEDNSYSTLFATLKQLHLLTLKPQCRRISAKLTKHLAPYFGDDLIIEVRCERIDDHDLLFSRIDKAMSAKAVTKNQVLRLLSMPVTEEEWGDEIAGTDSQEEQQAAAAQQEQPAAPEADGTGPSEEILGQVMGAQPGTENEEGDYVRSPNEAENEGSVEPVGPSGDILADVMEEPKEVFNSRPQPKKIGRGAMGGRMKSLPIKKKSLYDLVKKTILNGHAKH